MDLQPADEGGYLDAQTLTPEDEASYEQYRRRLCERYRVGEKADRLVRIVDRYMPAIADENRAYVMKCPHKVLTMLKQHGKSATRCGRADGGRSRKDTENGPLPLPRKQGGKHNELNGNKTSPSTMTRRGTT